LGLIKDHIIPLFSSEGKVVLNHQLVGGDANVEGILLAPTMSLNFPLFLGAKVSKDLESWTPLLELHFPVHDDGGWDDNEMRSPDSFVTGQRS
jgi:hypothetical protein